MAQNHLISADYEILETNWRFSKAEIDIIARKDNILIFIEVKTRSYTYYGEPEDSINEKKEGLLIDAAMRYMESIGHEWEIRFDIISIVLDKEMRISRLQHFEDAFH